jgi:hypothetical protein
MPTGVKMLPFIAVAAAVALATSGARANAAAGLVTWISVSNGGSLFQGDNRLLTTVSPNGDGFRDKAVIHFALSEAADVSVAIYTTRIELVKRVWGKSGRFSAGLHRVVWRPRASTPRQTYLVRLTALGRSSSMTYGTYNSWGDGIPGPVVRVQGVGAHFTKRSYRPGALARLVVGTDAKQLTVQVFRAGSEARRSYSPREMRGAEVTEAVAHAWRRRSRPGSLFLRVGDWTSGLYFAKLVADDGRVGFAPFVVAPRRLGIARVAVVLPTNTWAAYNFWDGNGDGYGDSWYNQSGDHTVVLSRAFLNDGVPPYFSTYDLGFIRWLRAHSLEPDFYSDDDIGRIPSGRALAAAYDLIVFPGHEEYVSNRVYDLIRGYRNRGGNLMFLSANNFFWRVVRRGDTITRIALFRDLGKPEAGLVGVQYRAHRNKLGCYRITNTRAVPWLFAGTRLGENSRLCHFGIEIDSVAPSTPPGTRVVARIKDLFGPGRSAAMTYYETPRGAKVFAAGTLNFGGAAGSKNVSAMLVNLWSRLSQP